ncbi:outer membrane beta-barrel protein [Fulvivirga ulvae]|uniref:outer membrane beta-barrel protein n=1 Tax=Fulvivirga ulvae TaxID=2904245 RepID=UPI002107EDB1|nr:outer membrane beta-barrel protein [Fulvivirga ulvae]
MDVPLFVTLKPAEFLTLMAGPQYSYLIKQKDEFTNAFTTVEQEQEFENDDVRKSTLGLAAGLDLNFEHAVVSGRVAWDIQKNNTNGSSTTPEYKNVWFQLALGYKL